MDEGLDELGAYLEQADILNAAAWALHGAHRSFLITLQGGVGVLAKPEDVIADGPAMIRREAAAWLIARGLDWPDLVAATVVRQMRSPDTGDPVEASVQVIWPNAQPDLDPGLFADPDVWRGAVYDAVVGHSDRNGHNWLATPRETSAGLPPQLRLCDHGYGFPDLVQPPNSTFYQLKAGHSIPPDNVDALVALQDGQHYEASARLLSSESHDAMSERIRRLLQTRTLTFDDHA